MGLNSLGLGFIFTARDLASPIIGRLNRALFTTDATVKKANAGMLGGAAAQRKFATSTMASTAATTAFGAGLGGLLLKIGPLAAGIVALGAAFSFANSASQFQQQLVATQQIMRATNEELAMMKEKVLDVGLRTKFSPDEIVEGMKNLGSAGLNAAEAMDTIEPSALLATAAQIGLDQASKSVIGTMRSFQMETSRAGEVSDKLTRIMQLTNFQGADFENGLSKAAAAAGQFGQSLDQTLVLLGALRNANIDASSSSTAVRELFRRIGSDKRAQTALKDLGIELDDANGKARSAIDIMYELDAATNGLADSKKNERIVAVTGARGLLGFNSAMKLTTKVMRDGQEVVLKGKDAFLELQRQVETSQGSVQAFNDAILDTFEGQKQILGGVIDTLKVVIGEGIASVLKPVVKFIADALTECARFIKDLSKETKELAGKFLLIGSVVMTVLGMVVLFGGAFVGAVAAAGAAFYGFVKLVQHNVGGVGDVFRNTLRKTWLFMKGLMQLITDGFLSGETLATIMEEENAGVLRTLGTFIQIGYRIKRFFEGVGAGIQGAFKENEQVFDSLFAALKELGAFFGITEDGLEGLTTSSTAFAEKGVFVGYVLGQIALGLVTALTYTVKLISATIKAGKWMAEHWNQITGAVKAAIVVYGTMMAVKWLYIGALFAVEAAQIAVAAAVWLVTSAEINGRLVTLMATVGTYVYAAALAVLRTAKLIILALTSRQAAAELYLKGALLASAAAARINAIAQGGLAGITKGLVGGLIGKAGLIAAAGYAGYAFGEWLDETFALSDGLADLIGDVMGLTDAMNNLSYVDADGNVVKVGAEYTNTEATSAKRGAPGFKPGPGGATTPVAKAPDVAGGIPQNMGHLPAGGIDPTMMADLANAERELAAVMKEQGGTVPPVNVYLDSEKVATAVARGQKSAQAREFGGD